MEQQSASAAGADEDEVDEDGDIEMRQRRPSAAGAEQRGVDEEDGGRGAAPPRPRLHSGRGALELLKDGGITVVIPNLIAEENRPALELAARIVFWELMVLHGDYITVDVRRTVIFRMAPHWVPQ